MVIARPSACTANIVHDFTGTPSSSTVHAPQFEVSHPMCVPVSPSVSRRRCTSSSRGSTSRGPLRAVDRNRDLHAVSPVQCRPAGAGRLDGAGQPAPDEHVHHVPLVRRASAKVVVRAGDLRPRAGPPRRTPPRSARPRPATARPPSPGCSSDPTAVRPIPAFAMWPSVQLDVHRHPDRGEVAHLALHLQVRAARGGGRRRDPDLGERSRSARSEDVKVSTRRSSIAISALARGAARHHLAPMAIITEPQSPAGSACASEPADRPAVADQRVADQRRGGGHAW